MSNLPATFEQRVKERISETIADLIPPDELSALVRGQVAHFQRNTLPELIKQSIQAQYAAALKAELQKPEYLPQWTAGGTQMAGEAIQKIITENAGQMLSSLVGSMVRQTVYQMQQNMPRY